MLQIILSDIKKASSKNSLKPFLKIKHLKKKPWNSTNERFLKNFDSISATALHLKFYYVRVSLQDESKLSLKLTKKSQFLSFSNFSRTAYKSRC